MAKLGFNFGIDVSGTPPELTVFGLASFSPFKQDTVIDEFFATFPQYINRKGRNLNRHELNDIIDFLNQRKVKMVTNKFSTNDWIYVYSKYEGKAYIKEKIFGILYFSVLRKVAWKQFRHPIMMCIESHININKAQEVCARLAEYNKFNFDFGYGHASGNRLIKIADYIASAGRKMKRRNLDQFENFIIVDNPIPPWVFRKIFK